MNCKTLLLLAVSCLLLLGGCSGKTEHGNVVYLLAKSDGEVVGKATITNCEDEKGKYVSERIKVDTKNALSSFEIRGEHREANITTVRRFFTQSETTQIEFSKDKKYSVAWKGRIGLVVSREKYTANQLTKAGINKPYFATEETSFFRAGPAISVYLWTKKLNLLDGDFSALNLRDGRIINYHSEDRGVEKAWIEGREISVTRYFVFSPGAGHSVWVSNDKERKLLAISGFSGGITAKLSGLKFMQREVVSPPEGVIESEISFGSRLKLSGTISTPMNSSSIRAGVVLVHGSGPVDRNGNAGGLEINTLRDLAYYLSANGFVVLRYDKRGVGKSDPAFNLANRSFGQLVEDANAAVNYLSEMPNVDGKNLFIIGHSEGGMIAPAVGAKNEKIKGVVSLAGPISRLDDILKVQLRLILKANGATKSDILLAQLNQVAMLKLAKYGGDKVLGAKTFGNAGPKWLRSHMNHDPQEVIHNLNIPLLSLYFGSDLQVPPSEADVLRATIEKFSKKNCTVMVIEDLDHLMMPVKEPIGMGQYSDPDRTTSPQIHKIILKWLLQR